MILFIPGGPGLNSEPERRLLGPELEHRGIPATFWSEPSPQRGDSDGGAHPFEFIDSSFQAAAYRAWVDNGRSPIDLVAHSFGAHYAIRLLNRFPERVRSLYLVAPCLDLDFCFKNILARSAQDFAELGVPDSAGVIGSALRETRSFHDEAMQRGLAAAFGNPRLMTHYWTNETAMGRWLAVVGEPAFALDVPGMARILNDYAATWSGLLASRIRGVPVRAVFGEGDHVVEAGHETRTLQGIAPDARCETWAGVAHFPHLESTERFLDDMLRFGSYGEIGIPHGRAPSRPLEKSWS